jgi:hypothetical protein
MWDSSGIPAPTTNTNISHDRTGLLSISWSNKDYHNTEVRKILQVPMSLWKI